MKPEDKTLINTLLSNPKLKSGLVVAPCLSGLSYALCSKAVDLALSGQEVLLVKRNRQQHVAQGGSVGMIEEITSNHPDKPKVRYSKDSGTFVIGEGKIKLAGLDFTPEKIFDTALFDGCVNKGDLAAKNNIIATSAYRLVEELQYFASKGYVTFKRNMKGDWSKISIQPTPEYIALEREPKYTLSYNEHGYFRLEVYSPDPMLVEQNPTFMACLNSLPMLERTRMLETDYLTCHHSLNYKNRLEEM